MKSNNIFFPMMHVRQKCADFKGWNAVLITVGREGETSAIIFNVAFHSERGTVMTMETKCYWVKLG